MRDVVCAKVASCDRGLHHMCPTTAHASIIQHCQVDPKEHVGARAARAHGGAKYAGAVESIISSEFHRVRGISCPSVVKVR